MKFFLCFNLVIESLILIGTCADVPSFNLVIESLIIDRHLC